MAETNEIAGGEVEELRQQFHVFDANGTGFIEKDELKEGLKTLGYQISDEGVENLLKLVGSTDDRLDFEEFIAWNRELYIEEMKQEFKTIDSDHSGWISKNNLKEYSKKMNYSLSEEDIETFLYNADENQDDRVGVDEYIAAVAATKSGKAYFVLNGEMYIAKLEADFKDMDVDGSGFVTPSNLQEKAKEADYFLSEEETQSLMKDMDFDGDGKISLEEFIASAVKLKTN